MISGAYGIATMNIGEFENLAEQALVHVLTDEFAEEIGKAKGMVIYREEEKKRILARLKMDSEETSQQGKEDWARQQQEYMDAVKAYARAETDYETLMSRRQNARVAIDAWQTACANSRIAGGVR